MIISKPTGALLGVAGLVLCFTFPSCSTNKDSGFLSTATGNAKGGARNGGGAGSILAGGVGTINAGEGGSAGDSGTMVACTDVDAGCDCPTVAVAVLGKPGQYGNGSDALMAWLNSSSAGTAKVDNYPDRTTLTADFLAPYNVIILLGLGDDSKNGPFWSYDATEQKAMQDWVTAGGGLITLSGAADSSETVPANQLLSFAGIAYNSDWLTPDCTVLDASGNPKCNCGVPSPINLADFKTDDDFVKQLATGITRVGVYGGRSITMTSADAHIAATMSSSGTVYNAIVGEGVGSGRVLAFTDEWITYTSQWSGSDTNDSSCVGFMPPDLYQTAQFWFNMIKWVQPSAACFKLVGTPTQEVVIW